MKLVKWERVVSFATLNRHVVKSPHRFPTHSKGIDKGRRAWRKKATNCADFVILEMRIYTLYVCGAPWNKQKQSLSRLELWQRARWCMMGQCYGRKQPHSSLWKNFLYTADDVFSSLGPWFLNGLCQTGRGKFERVRKPRKTRKGMQEWTWKPWIRWVRNEPTSMPFRRPKSGVAQRKEFWGGYTFCDDIVVDLWGAPRTQDFKRTERTPYTWS